MTNKEAINMLSMIKVDKTGEFEPLHTWYGGIDKDMQEAVELAKKALSQPNIEAIRKEIEKQKIMVSGSYLTKDQQSVFRNAINVALAVIDKHIRESREIMGCIADIVYGDVECNCNCDNCHWWDEQQESEEISDRNMKMWEELFKAEREPQERSDNK